MADEVKIEVIDQDNFVKYLNDLNNITERKVILAALRKGGNTINREAKALFQARKKNKSKTGYAGFNSMFKVQPIKKKEFIAVKVGMTGENAYKYRWLNWGTNEREYISKGGKGVKHSTGKIQPTNFFYDAVTSKTEESKRVISDAIIQSLQKLSKA